ncbi:hypothetical protein [Liquorilactobacillus capillatus]|uniref:hypothetical protein n=1 Tax=Liquorilactobacillus capillatus TaxID=480931 RepID=UPI000709D16D|nr:hypothetical protein [Liquorilactobacillus capillatus]
MEWKLGWYHNCDDYRALPFTFPELTEVVQATLNLNGDGIRLGLSNLYGEKDLIFQKVEAATDEKFHVKQKVTFAGIEQATVIKGTTLKSDPVHLQVKAGMKLYLKLSSKSVQTYADFCCTYDTTLTNANFVRRYASTPHLHHSMDARRGWFCLNEIEVLTDSQPAVVNITGDSLVEMGQISTSLAEIVYQKRPGKIVFANTGISGGRLLHDAPQDEPLYQTFGPSLLRRAATEAQKLMPVLTIAFIGSNDLIMPLVSKEALQQQIDINDFADGIIQLKKVLQRNHSRLLLGTLLPFSLGHGSVPHSNIYTQTLNKRQEINRYLRRLPETFDSSQLVEDDKQRLQSRYDFGDHLHLNKRGGQKIATAIWDRIQEEKIF